MTRVETVNFKGFKDRIRLTQEAEKEGCKITNCHEDRYIIITQEVPEWD